MHAYEYKIKEEKLAIQCIDLISGGIDRLFEGHRGTPRAVVRVIIACTLMAEHAHDPATGLPVETVNYVDKLIKGGDEEFDNELTKFVKQLDDCSNAARILFTKTIEKVLR